MKIVRIVESTRPIQSDIRNAYIDFSKMTLSGSAARRSPRTARASRRCWRCSGRGQRLAVDANRRFDLDTAVACGRALSAYPLFWYEEAGDPLDYDPQAKLGEVYAGPLATGENLISVMRAQVPQ